MNPPEASSPILLLRCLHSLAKPSFTTFWGLGDLSNCCLGIIPVLSSFTLTQRLLIFSFTFFWNFKLKKKKKSIYCPSVYLQWFFEYFFFPSGTPMQIGQQVFLFCVIRYLIRPVLHNWKYFKLITTNPYKDPHLIFNSSNLELLIHIVSHSHLNSSNVNTFLWSELSV